MGKKEAPLLAEDLIKAREKILDDIELLDEGILKSIELKQQLNKQVEVIKHLLDISHILTPEENDEGQG